MIAVTNVIYASILPVSGLAKSGPLSNTSLDSGTEAKIKNFRCRESNPALPGAFHMKAGDASLG